MVYEPLKGAELEDWRLTPIAHDRARAMGSLQPILALRKQAYLNTLAVYAVNSYLLYECDLWSEPETSDSTQPIYQLLDGAAGLTLARDLLIPQIGKVDCCVLLPDETTVIIPEETVGNIAAYIIVQFHQDTLEEVDLLGFFPSFDPNDSYAKVEISDEDAGWQSISDLSEYLDKYQELQTFKEGDSALIKTLREIEAENEIFNVDSLLMQIWYEARQIKLKSRINEKCLISLIKKNQNLQISQRGINSQEIHEAIADQDLKNLADQLGEKFAEILGIE